MGGLGVLRRTQATPWAQNPRVWLLALWAAPCLFFYVFIHMGQQGLIFVYLPICFLISARAGDALARQWPGGQALFAGCLAANALAYLFVPAHPLGPHRIKVLSEATLRDQDRLLQGEQDAVRAGLPPGGVLVADQWRFAQYYEPGVPLLAFDTIIGDDTGESVVANAPPLPPLRNVTALVWYDTELDARNHDPARVALLESHNGIRLRLLRRGPGEHFWVTRKAFGIAPGADAAKP